MGVAPVLLSAFIGYLFFVFFYPLDHFFSGICHGGAALDGDHRWSLLGLTPVVQCAEVAADHGRSDGGGDEVIHVCHPVGWELDIIFDLTSCWLKR